MCVLIFSTTFVENISDFKKNLAKYRKKCRKVLVQSTRYSLRILMKIEFSRQILRKVLNIKFNKNPFIGSRADRRA